MSNYTSPYGRPAPVLSSRASRRGKHQQAAPKIGATPANLLLDVSNAAFLDEYTRILSDRISSGTLRFRSFTPGQLAHPLALLPTWYLAYANVNIGWAQKAILCWEFRRRSSLVFTFGRDTELCKHVCQTAEDSKLSGLLGLIESVIALHVAEPDGYTIYLTAPQADGTGHVRFGKASTQTWHMSWTT